MARSSECHDLAGPSNIAALTIMMECAELTMLTGPGAPAYCPKDTRTHAHWPRGTRETRLAGNIMESCCVMHDRAYSEQHHYAKFSEQGDPGDQGKFCYRIAAWNAWLVVLVRQMFESCLHRIALILSVVSTHCAHGHNQPI